MNGKQIPNEFQFVTKFTDTVSTAIKTSDGYLARGHFFGEKVVELLLENGTWIIVKEIPTKKMETIEPQEDIINKPNHYHKNEIDVNGYLEKHFPKQSNVTVAEGFYIGNVIKYTSRHKEKGGLQDLEKAQFNLNKLKELWVKQHEKI